MGYGAEAYVWSLLAATGLFVVGGTLSVWRGVSELLHGESSAENYLVAYVVLGVAFVLESSSLLQALRQLHGEARQFDRDLLAHVLKTSDPTSRAVFAEDTAALIGIVVAVLGIGLHQLTGHAVWDAIGSILVGILLGVVAVVLIDRNRRFLVGEPASPELREAAIARLQELPEVASVRFIRLVFVGPKQLFLVASVDLEGDAVESQVAENAATAGDPAAGRAVHRRCRVDDRRTGRAGPAGLAAPLQREHTLAQAVGGRVHQTLRPLFDQESRQRHKWVNGELETNPGGFALGGQRVPSVLGTLLFGAHQRPAHAVVVHRVCQNLFIVDSHDPDDLAGPARVPLGVALENLDLLMGRRPLGQRLEVDQHGHDLVGRRLDDDFAGLGDGHAGTIAKAR